MIAHPVFDQVVAALAVDRVAGARGIVAAPQPVFTVIADERVGEGCAIRVLDADQGVHAKAGILGNALNAQVNMDGAGRAIGEGRTVPAGAAVEQVVARAATEIIVAVAAIDAVVAATRLEEIVAPAADQNVRRGAAGQIIGKGRASEVLDREEQIVAVRPRCRPVAARVVREEDLHAARGVGIAGSVGATAAVDPIIAESAFESVVAGDAAERRDDVREGGDCPGAEAIDVDPAVPIKGVVTVAAIQQVIAAFAGEDIGAAIPRQIVVGLAARQILNVSQSPVAVGCRLLRALEQQRQGDARFGRTVLGEAECVDAAAAIDDMVADADNQQVVAAAAAQRVVVGGNDCAIGQRRGRSPELVITIVADQRVAVDGPRNILDADQRVHALAGILGLTLKVEVDRDAAWDRILIECGAIEPIAAIDEVVAETTVQEVVAGAAQERVVAVIPAQAVIAVTAPDNIDKIVAGQLVVEGRAGQILYFMQLVVPGRSERLAEVVVVEAR